MANNFTMILSGISYYVEEGKSLAAATTCLLYDEDETLLLEEDGVSPMTINQAVEFSPSDSVDDIRVKIQNRAIGNYLMRSKKRQQPCRFRWLDAEKTRPGPPIVPPSAPEPAVVAEQADGEA